MENNIRIALICFNELIGLRVTLRMTNLLRLFLHLAKEIHLFLLGNIGCFTRTYWRK